VSRQAEAGSEQALSGIFIDVEVDDSAASDPELARRLEEVCPVDIFRDAGGRVETVAENLDECVLCELCLRAAPPGAVRVKKLYDGTELQPSGP
jgi:NAD-dependent dihydropyrimidine dehydrogenase PreA subunit